MKIRLKSRSDLSTIVTFCTKENIPSDLSDFKANKNEIAVRYKGNNTLLYCGLGESVKCSNSVIRTAAAFAVQKLRDLKRDSAVLISPAINGCDSKSLTVSAIEGILLGNYTFEKYKTEKSTYLQSLDIVGSSISGAEIGKIAAVCESVLYARDLVNENASLVTPQHLALEAQKLAHLQSFKVSVLSEKQISQKGLRLIEAVGKASQYPPRLICIEYRGKPKSKEQIAILGKGITFDSGGLNLKPSGSIETMRCDMAGAAVVLGVMKALATLRIKRNVIGIIAAAHNAIGSCSYFPGDIIRSFCGKTVEICNTDAEGRLVLADAISYCQKYFTPSEIIDFATLTGGILSCLADFVAGLFTNNERLGQKLFESGERTGERLWKFPLYEEYIDTLKSDVADIRNVSKLKKGWASSITGAAFIGQFIENDLPWAHLDIAGTAFNESQSRGEIPQYGTGFGVRLLIDYLIST